MISDAVKCCFEDEDVSHVRKNMGDLQVRRLPVVDRNKRLVGVLALADLGGNSADRELGHTLGKISQRYAWSVLALAVAATLGLLFLVQKGQASRAASLIYLVPPTSALMVYLGFGEGIGLTQLAGFAISAGGVALVQFARY